MHPPLGIHEFPPTTCIRIYGYVAKPSTNTVFALGQLSLREASWVRMIYDADLSLTPCDIKMMTLARNALHLLFGIF